MKVRLHVDQPLAAGQAIALTDGQANYLFNVMRLAVGAPVHVFNGRDGEWRADVAATGRRGQLVCVEETAPLRLPPDLWLVFAPLKKARTDFIVEKATELGAARILPVQTRFTNADRIRQDRLQAHAVEAAEQCGGTFVPEVSDLQPLDRLLAGWPADRRILWGDEHLAGAAFTLAGQPRGPWAILIGPEGGFAEAEQARLRAMPQVVPVSLGPRILRADTAAVAALALWQAALGDWG
jgi:16S rRNA (uracil1498-N3)-methyltransferase